jgi:hypothetical protein
MGKSSNRILFAETQNVEKRSMSTGMHRSPTSTEFKSDSTALNNKKIILNYQLFLHGEQYWKISQTKPTTGFSQP